MGLISSCTSKSQPPPFSMEFVVLIVSSPFPFHVTLSHIHNYQLLCAVMYLGSVYRYWSLIDEAIREAVVLRGVRVRLLISIWKQTHPLTLNFVTSLKSLCIKLANCSLDVVSKKLN